MTTFSDAERAQLRKVFAEPNINNSLFEALMDTYEGVDYSADQAEISSLLSRIAAIETQRDSLVCQMQVSSADRGDAVIDAARGMRALESYKLSLVKDIGALLGLFIRY